MTSFSIPVSPTKSFLDHPPKDINSMDLLILWIKSCFRSATPVLGCSIFMLAVIMLRISPISRRSVELFPERGKPTKFILPTRISTANWFLMAS